MVIRIGGAKRFSTWILRGTTHLKERQPIKPTALDYTRQYITKPSLLKERTSVALLGLWTKFQKQTIYRQLYQTLSSKGYVILSQECPLFLKQKLERLYLIGHTHTLRALLITICL